MSPRVLLAFVVVLPALACTSGEGARPKVKADGAGTPDPLPPPPDAAAPASPDGPGAGPAADVAGSSAPDTASTPAPDTRPAPVADAGPGGRDASLTDAGRDGGGGPVSDAGGVSGGTWPLTGCNQAMLMYPMIDRNMGRFPPGSCPPPESLKAACPGDSKIKVMMATASAFETGYVHPPEYATDEYVMTRWSSPGGASAWIRLDLGAEKAFKRIYLLWEAAHAADYDIVVSNDGATWMPLRQVRGGDGFQDILDVDGNARYLRMNGIRRGPPGTYGYSLFDFTVCAQSQ